VRYPAGATADIIERFDFSKDEVLDMASAIGAQTILAFPAYEYGTVKLDEAVEGFASLCDQADQHGLWVDLEFVPMLGLPNLADAWDVIRLADRPNSGIMLDTWHFARGNADLNLLREIPGERLRAVQLADGTAEPHGGSLFDDCLRFREFPGDGELPIIEPLRIIDEKGFLRSIGPEVFSDTADTLSARDAGRRSGESLRSALAKAGVSAGQ
jgi:sugar phosphate isomerase/epimerase